MERQNDLLDDQGDVALLPLGEHVIGASLPDTLAVAAELLHAQGGCGMRHGEDGLGAARGGGLSSQYRGAGPRALYAHMLRRYLTVEPEDGRA